MDDGEQDDLAPSNVPQPARDSGDGPQDNNISALRSWTSDKIDVTVYNVGSLFVVTGDTSALEMSIGILVKPSDNSDCAMFVNPDGRVKKWNHDERRFVMGIPITLCWRKKS